MTPRTGLLDPAVCRHIHVVDIEAPPLVGRLDVSGRVRLVSPTGVDRWVRCVDCHLPLEQPRPR